MSEHPGRRHPTSFEIKHAELPLLSLRLKSSRLDKLAAELDQYYGPEARDFFGGALVAVDLAPLPAEQARDEIDFQSLIQLMDSRGLKALVVRAGSQEQMEAAAQAGLPAAMGLPQSRSAADRDPADPAPEAAPRESQGGGTALIVDTPLRSGQQVYATNRDLVITSGVNPGAEVIADGNIHVYGPLRGRAIAGARGWSQARIFALDMEPELIAIAGVYRTTEERLPDRIWRQPAKVSLEVDGESSQLVFKPLTMGA